MTEEWRSIPGWEGSYEASTLGRVRSLGREVAHSRKGKQWVRERILKPADSHGYLKVCLAHNGTTTQFDVHVLIALTFLGPRPNGCDVCHEDGNKSNPALANLRYDTRAANMADAQKHGAIRRGARSPHAKLTEADVRWIRANKSAVSRRDMSVLFGVSYMTISDAERGKKWKHITEA